MATDSQVIWNGEREYCAPVSVSLDRAEQPGLAVNRPLVAGYVEAFRSVARDLGIAAEPDLNAILRMPGAMDAFATTATEDIHSAVLDKVEEALLRLEEMRSEEGRDIVHELRDRTHPLLRLQRNGSGRILGRAAGRTRSTCTS